MVAGRGNTKERGYGDLYNGAHRPLCNHAFCLHHQEDYWPLIVLAIIVSWMQSCENNLFIRCFYKLSSWMLRGAAPRSSHSAGASYQLIGMNYWLHNWFFISNKGWQGDQFHKLAISQDVFISKGETLKGPHWQLGPHLATSGVGGWSKVVTQVTEEINIDAAWRLKGEFKWLRNGAI